MVQVRRAGRLRMEESKMKRTKIAVLVCAVVACASLLLAGCQAETYTPTAKDQTVSSEALGKDGTLRVGVNAASAPLAGQSSSSTRIVGIDVDVAAFLADELGCKVEIVDVGNDPATALEEGTVDVVLGVDTSKEEDIYWRSDPYLQTGVVLFGSAAETSIPTVDSSPQVAAQASSKSSWRVTNLFGDDSLIAQDDLKSAFEAMRSGSVRYVAADAVIGTYVAFINDYDDKIVALLQDPSGYCAAVSSSNAELQAAVATAMGSLTNGGIIDIVESKWRGAPLNLSEMTVVKSASADEKKADDKKADDKKSSKKKNG